MTSLFSRVWAAICTTVLILVLGTSFGGASIRAQSPGKWKQLFNGKDLTGWQAIGGGGRRGGAPAAAPATPPAPPSTKLEERGWKVENGVITSAPPAEGQRQASLATADSYKDVELEFDFMVVAFNDCDAALKRRATGEGESTLASRTHTASRPPPSPSSAEYCA